MRVLLIEPASETFRMVPAMNLGLLSMAACLEQDGHHVNVAWAIDAKDMDVYLDAFDPDVVGFTCVTPHVRRVRELSAEVKRSRHKGVFTIAGGIHPTVRPMDLLADRGVDACCIGEGEYTLRDVCRALAAKASLNDVAGLALPGKDGVVRTPSRPLIECLDDLPWPARHLVPNQEWLCRNRKHRGVWVRRSEPIMTARGCPNRCVFCASHSIHGYRIRRRSPENVVAEIKHLIATYRIDHFSILDDTFTYPDPPVRGPDGAEMTWLDRFCDLVEQEKLRFTFHSQARAETVSDHIIRRLKAIGLKLVSFGFESGSDVVLANLHKGISVSQIDTAMSIVHRHRVKAHASFLVGVPGQTEDDIQATVDMIDRGKIDYVDFFIVIPFPGTELAHQAEQNGWLPADIPWERYEITDTVILKHDTFTSEQILAIKRRLQNRYMVRNLRASLSQWQAWLWGLGVLLRNVYILPASFRQLWRTRSLHAFFLSFLVNDRRVVHDRCLRQLERGDEAT